MNRRDSGRGLLGLDVDHTNDRAISLLDQMRRATTAGEILERKGKLRYRQHHRQLTAAQRAQALPLNPKNQELEPAIVPWKPQRDLSHILLESSKAAETFHARVFTHFADDKN